MRYHVLTTLLFLIATLGSPRTATAGTPERLELGHTSTGAVVTLIRKRAGWSISIGGPNSPLLSQPEPARVEVSGGSGGGVHEFNAAYNQASGTPAGVEATATIRSSPNVSFLVRDLWQLHDDVLSVQRTVNVQGSASGGFSSAVVFSAPKLVWEDANYLAPGVLYADPTYDGERSPGGTLLYAAHHLNMREDILPAPLLGLYFRDGASVAMLDPDATRRYHRSRKPIVSTGDDRRSFPVWLAQRLTAAGHAAELRLPVPRLRSGLFRRPRQLTCVHAPLPSHSRSAFRRATRLRFASLTTQPSGPLAATHGAGLGTHSSLRSMRSTYLLCAASS